MRTSRSPHVRRLRVLFVALLGAGLVMFGMTTPAAASTTHTVDVTLSGTTCDANTTVTTSTTSLDVSIGDIVEFTFTNNVSSGGATVECGIRISPTAGGTLLGWVVESNNPPYDLSVDSWFSVTQTTAIATLVQFRVGSVATTIFLSGGPNQFNSILSISLVESSSTGTNSTPPDLIQQFAVHPDNDCNSAPAPIDLFDVPRDGGWSKSWAQWPNEGTGGFVCTRQVMYQSATLTWVPRTSL